MYNLDGLHGARCPNFTITFATGEQLDGDVLLQAAQQFFKNKLTGKETVTTQNDPYQDWPKWYKTLYLCFPQINAFDKARKIEVPAKFEE